MCPGLSKHRVQPRPEGGLIGAVATTVLSQMGDHRSWHCPRHADPDGDAISRNPTTGVSACLHVSGRGRGICQYQRGMGGSEVSSLFGFWSMSKNVKDSTDRHWNMNFFFFSGKLTDKDGKKDNLDALTSFPLAWNFHLPIGQGGGRSQSTGG